MSGQLFAIFIAALFVNGANILVMINRLRDARRFDYKIERILLRLDDIEATLDYIKTTFDDMETTLDDMKTTLDEVERKTQRLRPHLVDPTDEEMPPVIALPNPSKT